MTLLRFDLNYLKCISNHSNDFDSFEIIPMHIQKRPRGDYVRYVLGDFWWKVFRWLVKIDHQNHHNETLGVKNALKCFTRKITKGYLRKLHKITITSDSIKIIFGLNWIPRKFWFSNFFDFQAEIVIFEWKSQKFKQGWILGFLRIHPIYRYYFSNYIGWTRKNPRIHAV